MDAASRPYPLALAGPGCGSDEAGGAGDGAGALAVEPHFTIGRYPGS
jgi:hypothetical protein